MFAPISVLLAGLFLAPVLPNGIQLAEISPQGDSVEIVAGYASGGLKGFPSITAARSLELAAYAAGGDLKFFTELERTGLRITVPKWAVPMFTDELAGLFKEIPAAPSNEPAQKNDFRSKVEAEIRDALVGSASQPAEFATDRAFVLFPGPAPDALRNSLAAIPSRPSKTKSDVAVNRLQAERTLRFKSDLESGGVVFATPTPAVYYKEWYSILLLDRVIRRVLPLRVLSELQLTTHPYYYRLEIPVPTGQFPEPVEETLLQELQRLQLSRTEPRVLDQAKSDARTYLDSKEAMEWFASAGIPERRTEGIEWIQAMTADDVRVAARDLLLANRVLATWSPKVRQTAVNVEDLRTSDQGAKPSPANSQRILQEGAALPTPAFPQHSDPTANVSSPEKLASGVSVVASNINGVFVSGGPLTKYNKESDTDTIKAFQNYRPDRILVLSPPQSVDSERRLWGTFRGNGGGNTAVAKGNVSAGDLPALVILKTLVDRKVIEAGWWNDVEVKISASEGSMLAISADADKRARIVEWIKRLGMEKPGDAEMAWAREVAIHRFGLMQADLQALTWERDAQGTLQNLETVSAGHVSDVARIYF